MDQDEVDVDVDVSDERSRISLSPEVDLSPPDLHDQDDHHYIMRPPTPGESFSGRSSLSRDESIPDSQPTQNRAPSPPLEADEKGFTETATAVRARGANMNEPPAQSSVEVTSHQSSKIPMNNVDETAEMTCRRDQELGYELFGHSHDNSGSQPSPNLLSSPMVLANDAHATSVKRVTALVVDIDLHARDDDLRSPEHVALDELDGMFSNF